ncbi:MAG: arsenate reductase ArsC [Gammaproteobacteria bacterium]
MADPVFNVLFLCTGNSARSILAESLLNGLGQGRFKAFSAGSRPAGQVNPLALALLEKNQFPMEGLRSKSWDEFARVGAPRLDFVITLCDNAAGEACPVWPGDPTTAHWGIPDPAAVDGSDDARRRAFVDAMTQMQCRISTFVSLPLGTLDGMKLQAAVRAIGNIG